MGWVGESDGYEERLLLCLHVCRVVHIRVVPRESYDLHVTAMRDSGGGHVTPGGLASDAS